MSPTLLLDAGNSRLKWALLDGKRWLADGACSHAELATLPAALAAWPSPHRLLGCNVAGADIGARLAALWPQLSPLWLRAQASAAGVRNGYAQPGQLGADRWAALIAARAHSPQASLVVMAGTALTVDALNADGEFLGGLIVPGFQLMRSALASGTAALGLPDGEADDFPRDTGAAIVNGALRALCGAISLQYQLLAERAGSAPALLLSGGDAERLLAALPARLAGQARHIDNLVLRGLAQLASTGLSEEKPQ